MMNNKDLIDKIISDINKLYGIEEMIYQKEVKKIIQKYISTTTESQTNDGEWIEKARQQYSMCMSPKRHEIHCELFKQSILSNIPKPKEVVAPVDIDKIMDEICLKGYSIKAREEKDQELANNVQRRIDEDMRLHIKEVITKHLKGTTPVEPINQERLSDYNDSGNVAKFVVDFCVKNGYSFNIHYAESCGEFELNIEDYTKTIYYNKKGGLSYYVPEALQSLQSESEVVQGEKKDWKRDYIRKIPSSEYVDWLKDNMWRLPQGPFECDRCRTERERRERRERGVQC